MKRKMAVVALLCAMMMALSFGAAQAANYLCTISGAGVSNAGYYYVTVTDTGAGKAFTNRNFLIGGPGINVSFTNAFYATALTAFANSTNVLLEIPDITEWSVSTLINAAK